MASLLNRDYILSQININDIKSALDDVKVLLELEWPKYVVPSGKTVQSAPTPTLRDLYPILRWLSGSTDVDQTTINRFLKTPTAALVTWWQNVQDEISRNALEFARSTFKKTTSARALAAERGTVAGLSPPTVGIYGIAPGDIKLVGQQTPTVVATPPISAIPYALPTFPSMSLGGQPYTAPMFVPFRPSDESTTIL